MLELFLFTQPPSLNSDIQGCAQLCGAFRLQGKEVINRQSVIQTSNLEHRVYVLRTCASEVISHFLLVLTAISCRDNLFAVCPDFSTICRTASEIKCKFVHTNSALS